MVSSTVMSPMDREGGFSLPKIHFYYVLTYFFKFSLKGAIKSTNWFLCSRTTAGQEKIKCHVQTITLLRASFTIVEFVAVQTHRRR